MTDYLYAFRERFHPLHHLRRHGFSRAVLRAMDLPIWATLPCVDWRVRVRLVRHAALFAMKCGGEPQVIELFRKISATVAITSFWDIGANIGSYVWFVKSLSPEAQVRMFEPDPDNVWLVQQTLRRAALNGIVLRDVAVSDCGGTKRFERDMIAGSTGNLDDGGNTFSWQQWHAATEPIIVRTVTIDDERRNQTQPVDLIKIDVEGHEETVVRGGRCTIEKDQPILIFECFHGGAEIIEYLSRIGYWVGDAERMSDDPGKTTNFLALPPRHRLQLNQLRRS
jgi:FkbM family methyltransferase